LPGRGPPVTASECFAGIADQLFCLGPRLKQAL
jgi:hypothetical protein